MPQPDDSGAMDIGLDAPESMPEAVAQPKSEFCIPSSAVAQQDETSTEVTPEVGDQLPPVTLEDCTVTRVENGNVYFTAKTANGVPLPEAEPDMESAEPMPDGDEQAGIMADAEKIGAYR